MESAADDGETLPVSAELAQVMLSDRRRKCQHCGSSMWTLIRSGRPINSMYDLVLNALQQLPTIGPTTAKRLLKTFGEKTLAAMLEDNVYEFVNLMDENGDLVFSDRQAKRMERSLASFEFSIGQGGYQPTEFIKRYLLADVQIVLWSLLIGGFVMIFFEKTRKPEAGDTGVAAIPYKKAFLIGLFQSLAVIPGVSRSAATIVGGMLLGVERRTIVEFSFLLAVPTMAAATALDLLKNGDSFSADQTGFLMIGFVGSFIFAFLCIKWLLNFVKRHTFTGFGIYRIAAALFFMFWFSR